MGDVPARELRNDTAGVLRRVEAGERVRITVSGRPVAEIVPLPTRPRWVAWERFIQDADRWRADPGLARDLAELLPETTDDVPFA
jgi:prevent-host-death family protein